MALIDLLNEYQTVLKSVTGSEVAVRQIQGAIDRLNKDSFRVLIAGDLNRGKTTLLNALLGKTLFYASAIPVYTVNTVYHGKTLSAIIERGKETQTLSEEMLHLPPSEDAERVTMTLDHPLLQKNVEIVEHPAMTGGTPMVPSFEESVNDTDSVILVLTCDALFSKTESDALSNDIMAAGHRDIFVVCNRLDRISIGERETVRQHGLKRISAIDIPQDRVFFLSAETGEGVTEFTNALSHFLANDRVTVKNNRAIRLINLVHKSAHQNVLERVKAAQETAKPTNTQIWRRTAERITERKDVILKQVNDFRQTTQELVSGRIDNFVEDLVYKIRRSGKTDPESLANEANAEFQRWYVNDLSPYINDRLQGQFQQNLQSEVGSLRRLVSDVCDQLGLNSRERNHLLDMNVSSSNQFVQNDINGLLSGTVQTDSATKSPISFDLSEWGQIISVALATGAATWIVGAVWVIFLPIMGIPVGIAVASLLGYQKFMAHQHQFSEQQIDVLLNQLRQSGGEQKNKINIRFDTFVNEVEASIRTFLEVKVQDIHVAIADAERRITEADAQRQEVARAVETEALALDKLAGRIAGLA